MTKKVKIVLRGKDSSTEHAQGIVDASKYASIRLVERNGHVYSYDRCTIERGIPTMLFSEKDTPAHISEF